MAAPKTIRIESTDELHGIAEQWDDLWRRSDAVLPTGQAQLIIDWIEQLAPDARLIAIAIEQDGQLVAALPLVARKLAPGVWAGALPLNSWCFAGELLLDPSADNSRALGLLVQEIRRLPWPLLWLDAVPLATRRWRQFLAALDEAGLGHTEHEKFQIGTVEIADQLARDWSAYEAAWSGNHRRHMRKALKRAQQEGGVELDARRPRCQIEVEPLLREGFEAEHRSWKGREGSSVLCQPQQWKFYLRQATELAQRGQLELSFLRHKGQAIAFEYGWSAGGIYYTPKVGYDDGFERYSPGQLLRYFVFKDAFQQADRRTIDFLGPLSEATAKWCTRTYPICRLVAETGGGAGRGLLWAYRRLIRPMRQRLRTQPAVNQLSIIELDVSQAEPLSETAAHA